MATTLLDLNREQEKYMRDVLLIRADEIVTEIVRNPQLLRPLILERLIHDDDKIYDKVLQVLKALPDRMRELLKDKKFKINDALDVSQGAMAACTETPPPITHNVQLRTKLLDRGEYQDVTSRLIDILHEVSHTLAEGDGFPIKDFAYSKGWALSHLGSLCARNADNIAEAAMAVFELAQIHEAPLTETAEFLFRRYDIGIFQRFALRQANASGLGAALAWADLRVNRAWLMMLDYRFFALSDNAIGEDRLMAFEAQLLKKKVISERARMWVPPWTPVLDKLSKDAVNGLATAVIEVKGRLSAMHVRVVDTDTIDFSVINGRFRVGYELLKLSTTKLGSMIIETLFSSLEVRFKLPPAIQATELIDLCLENDRQYEKGLLPQCFTTLESIVPTPVDLDDAHYLDALLYLAITKTHAVLWRNNAIWLKKPLFVDALARPPGDKEIEDLRTKFLDLGTAMKKPGVHKDVRTEALDTLHRLQLSVNSVCLHIVKRGEDDIQAERDAITVEEGVAKAAKDNLEINKHVDEIEKYHFRIDEIKIRIAGWKAFDAAIAGLQL